MEQETTAVMAVSLPDDLLLEILVRVKDEPSLFRCATACKRWRHLITDPSFLRCRWPDHDYSSSLVGFFTWDGEEVYKSCFVPTPRSPLGPGLRALSSFVTAAPVGIFNGAVPLVSRHGVLLVRLEGLPANDVRPDFNILQLAVCNLLLGTFHVIPPVKFAMDMNDKDDYELSAFAVLTGADCCSKDETSSPSNSSFFQVVILTSDYDARKYSIHIFSSDEARWSVRTNCFDDTSEREDYGQFGDAVICHGTAHWLSCYCGDKSFHVISMNARTSHIFKTKLGFLTYYFHTSDIFLTLGANGKLEIWMQTGSQLDIWGQQENQQNVGVKHSEWVFTRTMEQNELGEESHGRELWVFGEKCGTLIVNEDQHLYTADLETRRMEEVSNWPGKLYISRWGVLPLEMDWPSIFISQLKI